VFDKIDLIYNVIYVALINHRKSTNRFTITMAKKWTIKLPTIYLRAYVDEHP